MKKLFGIFKRGINQLVEPKEQLEVAKQAKNIVFLLMRDFNAKEQNNILKTVVADLKVKRKEQEQQRVDELNKLISDNEVLYKFSV
jgi:hypothetical protein